MSNWTKESPEQAGFYWVKSGKEVSIVEVKADMSVWHIGHNISTSFEDLEGFGFWYKFPISTPKS